jgi:hypothetical protein
MCHVRNYREEIRKYLAPKKKLEGDIEREETGV